MKRCDWRRAYEPLPESLDRRVRLALIRAEEEKPVRKHTIRTIVIALAILLAISGAAYAIIQSKTADIFGWFYGDDKREELLSGDLAQSHESYQLGDVVYTLDDAIYKDGWIYGTGTIRPADGANIVLICEDYSVNNPAGYLLFYGDETIPADAPSYAELAQERGAKIVLAKCVANGVLNDDGTACAIDVGYTQLPQADGTIRFTFEFDGDIAQTVLPRADRYEVSLYIANWEVTADGTWLRGEPEDTLLKMDWTVSITPTVKGE